MSTLYYESASSKVMEISEEEFHAMYGCTSVKISVGYFDYSSSTYFTYDKTIAEKWFAYYRTPYKEREFLDRPVSFNLKDELKIWWTKPTKFIRKIGLLKDILKTWFIKRTLRKMRELGDI